MTKFLLRTKLTKWILLAGGGAMFLLPGACEKVILRIATPFLI